jgi:beta-glucosidase
MRPDHIRSPARSAPRCGGCTRWPARPAAWGGSARASNTWSPNINIFRDPRWGRGQETYGEDPFLTARMGVAFVKACRATTRISRIIATPKHFAVHSGPESTRHSANVFVSRHDLEDTYLPAFRAADRRGQGRFGDVRL